MAGTIAPAFGRPFTGNDGKPLNGGKLYAYLAGTTTPTPMFTDVGLTVPWPNPLILDSSGRPPGTPSIFLAATSYKFELRTAADALVWIVDNVPAVPANEIDLDIQGVAGEALADRDVVFLSNGTGGTTPGRWYKADADIVDRSTGATIIGIVPSAIGLAAVGAIRLQGRVTGFSGLTPGAAYFISTVAGQLTSVAPGNARFIGSADSTTTLVMTVSGIAAALPGSPVFTTVAITSSAANALDVGGGIEAGTGNVQVVDATGKIPAIDATRFASLSGANLTGLLEAAIADGTILARLAANEVITGLWDFDAPTVFSAPSDRNIIIVTNPANKIALRIRGNTSDNLANIDFTDQAEVVAYGIIGITPGGGLTYSAFFTGHTFSGAVSLLNTLAVAGNGSIGGTLAVTGVGTYATGVAVTANPSNATALQVQGRSGDNTSAITFNDTTASTEYARIEIVPGAILDFQSTSGAGFTFSGGRINSNASQPGFLAFNSADDAGQVAGTRIPLDSVVFDNASNLSSDLFTAPVAGQYHFDGTAAIIPDTVGVTLDLQIETSSPGAVYPVDKIINAGAGIEYLLKGGTYVNLNSGGTAALHIYTTGGTVTIVGAPGGSRRSRFSGRLVP